MRFTSNSVSSSMAITSFGVSGCVMDRSMPERSTVSGVLSS